MLMMRIDVKRWNTCVPQHFAFRDRFSEKRTSGNLKKIENSGTFFCPVVAGILMKSAERAVSTEVVLVKRISQEVMLKPASL